jgi:pyruvate/2-oxoglutarate dehydrogenase complex dihydrolipoamide dehydrogenase (E3) component
VQSIILTVEPHDSVRRYSDLSVNVIEGEAKILSPWATFIDPEVARVGLNEQDAKEQGIAYEGSTYHLDDLDRAIADSAWLC